MQKKDILLGAGLTSVLVGAGVVNTTVQADEFTQPTTPTTVQKAVVTGQDLSRAQEVARSAQTTIDQKTNDVKVAEGQQSTAEKAVADVKEDIKMAQKAATIVEEQNKVIGTKTEQKSELNAELSDAKIAEQTAKSEFVAAQQAHDNATKAVTVAEKTVEEKKAALNQATATTSQDPKEIQTELDDVNSQVTAKSAQIAATSTRIDAKQQEVDNYKPVIKTIDLNPSERNVVAHDNLMDYAHNRNNTPKDPSGNPTMEPVNFQGVKVVEIEATQDMLDFQKALEEYNKEPYDVATRTYKKRPVFRYKVDNRGLSQAFVKLLNELREANGVAGNMQVDEAYLDYAQQRANEMQRNNVLSHATSLTAPGHKNEKGLENVIAGYGDVTSSEDGYINFNNIVTNETLAYDMLLNWYDDYTNVTGANHGHRRALLTPMGGKMGLALANITGSNDTSRYAAFENNAHTGSTYSTDEDGTTYLEEESESSKKFWDNYNNFKDDALNPTFYGRKMKFIADHHFVFVTHKQEGDDSAMVSALNDLKALKARQEGERNTLAARQTALSGKLSAATRSKEQRATAIANAANELNKATATLATAKLAAKATATTLAEKRIAADRATSYVGHLSNRLAAIQDEIDNATAIRNKAVRLQGRLGELNAKLTKAEDDKIAADKRVADAKVAYAQAQKELSDAKSSVQRLTDILAIDKALAVYQDMTGVVSAVTRETPTVTPTEHPTFDLNAELNGYKVTQNEDGIGATTIVTPTVDELPTLDLSGELNGYKVKQNKDGIGSTPITTPTVDELPTFDLNGYKTSPKHAGAGPNDTPSQTLSTFSRKDATKQELPNTGSYSRVERQIALGGYTILGLILGFTIQRKRKRER
ncbi:CAP domain-containing protein [Streptococcus sp. 151470009-6]